MANYAIFGGAGYFTGPTLGNLLTANKIRIFAKKVRIPLAGGFLFSQSGAGSNREFGLLFNSGELRYIYGSSTERLLLTTAELNTIAGTSAPWSLDSIDFRTDSTAMTAELYINGVLRKSLTLQKGASRIDGMLFRLGARSNADSTDTSGGFITPSDTWIGDTDVYINDVLVRRYTMPSTGNTVPESVSSSILTQQGTWPGGDSEWGSYVDPQGFTVNQSAVQAGSVISGTYTGWPTAPTATLVLTDTSSNTLTLTPTVTGGAGSGTWSATIPSLPAAGSDVELLKFGATTVSFSGFTAKAGPTLQVATTQTLATLVSGFDDYVFQGWSPQPAVGDQLVTVTADGIFNSNGDYTFYAEGVYPVWYVDGTGQVYGRTIDTSGLNQTDYLENLNLSSETISYKSLELVSGTGYIDDLPLNSISVSYKTLVENFGISYLQSLPLSSSTVTPKTLTLTAFGVGYSPDLPLLSIPVDSKQLQFVSFKNIPLDSKRIFYIK